MIDRLTGLPGRDLLDSIQDEFSRREPESLWTFLMIDVDHFKLINDIYGHLIGDQVLAQVAHVSDGEFTKKRYHDPLRRR